MFSLDNFESYVPAKILARGMTITYREVEAEQTVTVAGKQITPVHVTHTIDTAAFIVADAKKTIASKEGLSPLRTKKAVSGGFFTMLGFVASLRTSLTGTGLVGGNEIERAISAMPHHGETPILQTIDIQAGKGPTMVWHVWVPKGVIEDVAALGPAIAAGAMHGPTPIIAPPPMPPEAP